MGVRDLQRKTGECVLSPGANAKRYMTITPLTMETPERNKSAMAVLDEGYHFIVLSTAIYSQTVRSKQGLYPLSEESRDMRV